LKSKTVHIRITPEILIEAFMESLYFNKDVERVKVYLSRFGHEVPTHNVHITCSGRGRVKGKIVEGVFHGTIYGTEKEIGEWMEFLKMFVEVPGFELSRYIKWLKSNAR